MDNHCLDVSISPRRYAFDVREATTRDFDDKNKAQLEAILAELGKILTIEIFTVAREGDLTIGARFDSFALSKNAVDILISALHMARQRAIMETLVLLRVALETGGTALHISKDAIAYEQYKNGKYHSTDSIKCANKDIPNFGKIWGLLSNHAVHITKLGYGPVLKQEEGNLSPTISIQYSIRAGHPFDDHKLLSFISLIIAVVLKITEITLFQQSHLGKPWLNLLGTQMEYFHDTDALISKYLADITSISETKAGEEE